ncbi:MAG TPA: hypothetical protein VGO95_13465 [Modestobacter sp.]|nr:hypothetical protein [Modestobacter sp.]
MSEPTGYSRTPLPAKLGIRPGGRVLLDSPPFGPGLGPLPEGVTLHRRPGRGTYEVIVLVAPASTRLRNRWPTLVARLSTAGRLWVCWPKQSSAVPTDLGEAAVRKFGLAEGLVDVKVCAVDATWSGLAFVRRVRDR